MVFTFVVMPSGSSLRQNEPLDSPGLCFIPMYVGGIHTKGRHQSSKAQPLLLNEEIYSAVSHEEGIKIWKVMIFSSKSI